MVSHHTKLTLVNCRFVVHKSGFVRYQKEGIRNVHAYVEGDLLQDNVVSPCCVLQEARYNLQAGHFCLVSSPGQAIEVAHLVELGGDGKMCVVVCYS